MADLDLAEKLICERYNVASLPESFAGAMTGARGGDASLLRELLADREMYRWREPIEAALAGAEPEPEPMSDPDEPETTEALSEEPEAEPTRKRSRS